MTDYTTIRVTQAAKDAAAESKRESETWNDFLQRCTDNPPAVREFVSVDDIRAELETDAPSFDDVQSALSTIEERTGRIERTLDDMEARR